MFCYLISITHLLEQTTFDNLNYTLIGSTFIIFSFKGKMEGGGGD